jgi:hypothetical protein
MWPQREAATQLEGSQELNSRSEVSPSRLRTKKKLLHGEDLRSSHDEHQKETD